MRPKVSKSNLLIISLSLAFLTGETLPIKSVINCQTEGVLYKLDCMAKGCNEICYVGETMKRAEERFVGHLNTINLDCYENTNLPVGRHYRDMPGHSQSDIRFTPFEKLKSKDPFVRKARESEIINKFDLLLALIGTSKPVSK